MNKTLFSNIRIILAAAALILGLFLLFQPVNSAADSEEPRWTVPPKPTMTETAVITQDPEITPDITQDPAVTPYPLLTVSPYPAPQQVSPIRQIFIPFAEN